MESKEKSFIKSGNLSALWYRGDGEILLPAAVSLVPRRADAVARVQPSVSPSALVTGETGGEVGAWDSSPMLQWTVGYVNHQARYTMTFGEGEEEDELQRFVSVPSRGCLKEFAALADAAPSDAPDRVLDFVRRRGVLGLWPQPLNASGAADVLGTYRLLYVEPVSLYTRLAGLARYMLDALQLVRGPKNITEKTIENLWRLESPEDQAYLRRSLNQLQPTRLLYAGITSLAGHWSDAATLKLRLNAPLPALQAPFRVDLGRWDDGLDWDAQAIDRMRPGQAGEMARVMGRRSHFALMPHYFPDASQRPSPLFNALTLELLQNIGLPPGHYICAGCEHPFNWDPSNPEHSRKRPRLNRATFCSFACEAKYGKQYHLNYDSARSESRKAKRRAMSDKSDTAP